MKLVDSGIDEKEAIKKAHNYIRENIGNIPSPGEPKLVTITVESIEGNNN